VKRQPFIVKRHEDGFAVFARNATAPIPNSWYADRTAANSHRDAAEDVNVQIAGALAELIAGQTISGSAIAALQASPPMLSTVRNVEILKTGIEYPLSTGPATFTPEDLADAVAAQDDPAISQPRIWLGHPDDPRIHGKRAPGGPPSGEPAVGKVTSMHLEEDGNLIVGDLEGTPRWIAHIMASAYPSRSIEANFDVETVTGHKWRLVISGLALLGVVWPGVSTLEDIASLYTEAGPDGVEVIEASQEAPVNIIAAAGRTVVGQITVEDLRRQYYESLTGDQAWWWIRAIYLDPNELIVDDDEGALYRVTYDVNGDQITFADPKAVKVKYVNAANGGVTAETINANRTHVALFASRAESRPDSNKEPEWIGVALSGAESGGFININLRRN